jgi:hypothetical protein
MNIWKHCLLSQKKFGGKPEDYVSVHKFLDSSKLFYYHLKHRLLLHNLYGIEICVERLGDFIVNTDGKTVLVRDVAAEHCKEDLYGAVPTLNDWLKNSDEAIKSQLLIPTIHDATVEAFLMRPFLRSGLHSSLLITYSNFGVYLVEQFFGAPAALELAKLIPATQTVQQMLKSFQPSEKWQYTPDKNELNWLNEQENGQQTTQRATGQITA